MSGYSPRVFNVGTVEQAKNIILTSECEGADTETRWEHETPYTLDLIQAAFPLRPNMIVLDYGCGIGRMAKAMIEASGCCVVGVDISLPMRRMAREYVRSDRFIALSRKEFDLMVYGGLRIDAFISIWVLQHCETPSDDIARIRRSLKPDASGFVLNQKRRAIPHMPEDQSQGFSWHNDQVDVSALLQSNFQVAAEGIPDQSRIPNGDETGVHWLSLRHQ